MNSPGGQVVTVVVGMFGWVEIDSNGGFSRDRVSRLAFAAACFFFPVPFRVSRLFSLPAPAALAQWLVYMAGGALGLVFWECNHRGVGESVWPRKGKDADLVMTVRSGGRGVEGQNAQQDPFKSGFPPFFPCRAWSVRACLLGGLLAASRSRCEGARGGTSGTPPRDGKQPYLPSVRCWGRWVLDSPGEVPTRSETRAECGDSSANTDTWPLWEPPSGKKFRELGGLRAANLPRVPDISDPASKPPDWCG